MTSTWTESVWDEHERALVDAYKDWVADLHPACGQPLSRTLKVNGEAPEDWVLIRYECSACETAERQRAASAPRGPDNKPVQPNPDAWHVDRIVTKAEAEALLAKQGDMHDHEWDESNWK